MGRREDSVGYVHDHGGDGAPILLLHGLMGRGRTWYRHVPWLRGFGRVHTYDAPFHRGATGRPPASGAITTEAFTADVVAVLETIGPARIIGHSMGGLHGWCAAAARPDLVSSIVVEDIGPDFRGRTAAAWLAMVRAWPAEFTSPEQFTEFFGENAGRYFRESFDRTGAGWRLHGDVETFLAISEHWGTRDHWAQWEAVECPSLLVEAGAYTVVPDGQMAEMARRARAACTHVVAPGADHLVHDSAPGFYRAAVEGFLAGTAKSSAP